MPDDEIRREMEAAEEALDKAQDALISAVDALRNTAFEDEVRGCAVSLETATEDIRDLFDDIRKELEIA